ncbi:MAG: RNA polymerase sigma-70 factor [Bacteroidales bacterium]|nr:RNA polymerase sigma-70 factor [Bacteroidales bacterium]
MVLNEQQQLRKIRKGDIDSFEKLFHRFYPGLCNYAESLVTKEEVAEEVVQDVFYNVWKNRESLRIHRTLQGYLYRAVYNNSMMYLRKTRREFLLDDRAAFEQAGDTPDPSQLMQYNEVTDLIAKTLEDLPARTREIFRMNRQEGLKYREIADRLSISVKTVEANMGKALKALRTSLEKYTQE